MEHLAVNRSLGESRATSGELNVAAGASDVSAGMRTLNTLSEWIIKGACERASEMCVPVPCFGVQQQSVQLSCMCAVCYYS